MIAMRDTNQLYLTEDRRKSNLDEWRNQAISLIENRDS